MAALGGRTIPRPRHDAPGARYSTSPLKRCQSNDSLKRYFPQHTYHYLPTTLAFHKTDSLSPDAIETTISDSFRGCGGGVAESKIIELAKKARRLTVALEKEKTINSTLLGRIKQMERQDQIRQSASSAAANGGGRSDVERQQAAELKLLKEKFVQTTQKLEDERLQAHALRVELRNAHKALVAEVGEDVPLAKILDSTSGWKGRAQQIHILKDKLQAALRRHNTDSAVVLSSNDAMTLGSPSSSSSVQDDRHRSSIRKIETERRVALEKAAEELEKLRAEHADLKSKHEGVLARNKTLERHLRDLKPKVAILVEKASKDDALVKALQGEVEKWKTGRTKKDDIIYDNLKAICSEQEAQISKQEHEIARLERDLALQHRQPSYEGTSSHDVTIMTLHATLRSLTVENDRLKELKGVLEEGMRKAEERVAELVVELKRERRK
ncbi:Coiled-coil domain-containing protein 13, partial [Borealophlyctis nickersoniae]